MKTKLWLFSIPLLTLTGCVYNGGYQRGFVGYSSGYGASHSYNLSAQPYYSSGGGAIYYQPRASRQYPAPENWRQPHSPHRHKHWETPGRVHPQSRLLPDSTPNWTTEAFRNQALQRQNADRSWKTHPHQHSGSSFRRH